MKNLLTTPRSRLKVGHCYFVDNGQDYPVDIVVIIHVSSDVVRAIPALSLKCLAARDLDTRIAMIQDIIDWDIIVADTTMGRYALFCDEERPVWFSDDGDDEVCVTKVPGLRVTDNSICHFWRTRRLQLEEAMGPRA